MTGKPVLAASAIENVLLPDPASPVTMTRRPNANGASLIAVSVPQVPFGSTRHTCSMVASEPIRRRQLMQMSMHLEAALKAGDVDAARAALEDSSGWPNCADPYTHCTVLSIALGWSDLTTIRRLLDDGADPNYMVGDDGFPS